MLVLGFDVEAETSVSGGRVDAVLELPDKVYVIEMKYTHSEPGASDEEKRKLSEKSLEDGMSQLSKKGYAKKYAGTGKEAIQVALAFLGRDNIEMAVVPVLEQ